MKKILILTFIPVLVSSISVSAQQVPLPCMGDDCNQNGGSTGEGDGGPATTPIDDYAPLLVVTAIGIAGTIYYRQRQLIKK